MPDEQPTETIIEDPAVTDGEPDGDPVVEDTGTRFEIVINRCLVFESFDELGIAELSRWMCDIAFEYFNGYHPRLTYQKDRMIARGDSTCHEVFTWQ